MSSTAYNKIMPASRYASRSVLLGFCACVAAACGGSDKAAGSEEPTRPGAAAGGNAGGGAQPDDGVQVTGQKGVLSKEAIQAGIGPHAVALEACYKDRLKERKYLSGRVLIAVDVAKTGDVSEASVDESDVGDWAVERCLVGIARQMRFAPPTGGSGEALFKVPLHFNSDQAAAETWPEERIAALVAEKRASLDACAGSAGSAPASATITLYVGNRGETLAVGVSSNAEPVMTDAWAECAAAAVATWTFPDPLGKIIKTGFRYAPAGQTP